MTMERGGIVAVLAAMATVGLSGCSSGVTLGATGTPVAAKTTTAQVLITDAPADQVIALGLTVNSIRLFDAAGKYADVLTAPVTIEASHLDAVLEPLRAALSIPQDTYTSATITVSNPSVTYIDPTTRRPVQATATLTSGTDTITFNSPITVSSTSASLCFDLLVGQSVLLTGTTAAVTPTFNVTSVPLAGYPTNGGNGRFNDVFGSFVSYSGATLTVQTTNGTQVAITTDSNTMYQGFASLGALTVGELLDVDVAQQPAGALLAVRIHIAPANAANELIGPVTAVTGSPATSFTLTARQWLGGGTGGTTAGTAYTVAVTGATTFSIGPQLAPQLGTLTGLPFTPVFTAARLTPGQNVAVEASTISGTTAAATTVSLVPQTVDGTVTAIGQSGGFTVYTVTLPSGSALASLSGATTVTAYSNANTQFWSGTGTVAVGSTVRFNGLLFNDAGTLRLVGAECSGQPGTAPPQHH